MKEQFEYGEWVMVRNYHWEHWQKRYYIDTVESKDTGLKWYHTYAFGEEPGNHKCDFVRWSQIRKIQKDKTKSPETSPTRKEASQLRDDANWAIEQALTIGHREYGEVVRAAKLIIESQKELIKFMKEGWTD